MNRAVKGKMNKICNWGISDRSVELIFFFFFGLNKLLWIDRCFNDVCTDEYSIE